MTEPRFNVHDGPNGRDGGPYLDQIEMREAEIRRAAAEGREPDFDNMIGTAGVPLVTADQLVKLHHVQPSEQDKPLMDATDVLANVDNPDVGAPVMSFASVADAEEEVTEEPEEDVVVEEEPVFPTE